MVTNIYYENRTQGTFKNITKEIVRAVCREQES